MGFKQVLCFLLLLCFLAPALFGQNQDSVAVVQLLNQGANTDSTELARDKYKSAYTVARQTAYEEGVLEALARLADLEIGQNNTIDALRYLLEELELRQKRNDQKKLPDVNIRIGDLYSNELLHEEALKYYHTADSLLSTAGGPAAENLYEKLGISYTQIHKPDSAYLYYSRLMELHPADEIYTLNTLRKLVVAYQKAEKYESSLDFNHRIQTLMESDPAWEKDLGNIYNNLGYNYNFLGDYEKAVKWFQKSEPYLERDNGNDLVILYTNLGIVYFNLGNIKLSTQYLLKALSLSNSSDYSARGNLNHILANVYLSTEDLFNAQQFNETAIAYAKKSSNTPLKSKVFETAADIHSRLFEYEEAIEAFKVHLELRDSLASEKQKEQDQLIQDKLNLEKAEKEIRLLVIRGELQDLTIEQLKLETEKQQLALDNFSLKAEQTEKELALLKQSEEIKEARIRNQELETQQTRQELLLAQQELEVEQKERALNELAQKEALAQSELERKEALLNQEEQRVALLEQKQEIDQLELERRQNNVKFVARIGLLLFLISLLILAGLIYAWKTNKKLGRQKLEIEEERQKSDGLLLNILPLSIANELKEKGRAIPRRHENVTILFSDFVDFTRITASSTPEIILSELNDCFSAFDMIMESEGIEKIQTIGDGYLAACGLPEENPEHAVKCILAAQKMIAFLETRNETSPIKWNVRIGIHSGPITAGVVGKKKFAYNLFGDTINTASRIETSGAKNRINVSATTYDLIKDQFSCEYRGKIQAKGKGDLDMYFVR